MHRRIIPFASSGDIVPKATFSGDIVPKATFSDAPGGASLRFIYSLVLRASSAPSGHLPRKGEVYIWVDS